MIIIRITLPWERQNGFAILDAASGIVQILFLIQYRTGITIDPGVHQEGTTILIYPANDGIRLRLKSFEFD